MNSSLEIDCWYYVHLRVFSQLPGGSDEVRSKVANKNTKENKLCEYVSILFRIGCGM